MRWIIDRLEDALAMCEDEKGELIPISRDKLPENAREGMSFGRRAGIFPSPRRRRRAGAEK